MMCVFSFQPFGGIDMPTEDNFKVSLFYHTSQRQMIATHYYQAGAITTLDPFEECEALAQAFLINMLPEYTLATSVGTNFGCVKVEMITGSQIPTFINHLTTTNGLRVGNPLPPNCAAIIRRRGVFAAKPRRSLVFLGGVSVDDTLGSFLAAAFVTGALANLSGNYNDQILSTSLFNLAEWNPQLPHTPRVYARDAAVTSDLSANTMTLTDGTNWSTRGFITGGQFRISSPSRNRGTYFATVTPASPTIALTTNELEFAGPEQVNAQQVTAATSFFTLQSSVIQTAIRQLARRRSSHTGIVA